MYLVTGATGQVGRRIVRHLCEQGKPVRALVRFRTAYEPLVHWGAQICVGDLRYPEDIRRACEGVEVILSTHGSRSGRVEDVEQVDLRGNLRLIQAAQEQGIRHFTYISVLGAPQFLKDAPVFKAKAAVESTLRCSDLNYTILRPSGLASNILDLAESFRRTGIYLLLGDGKSRSSLVSTDDLAQMAIRSVEIPEAQQQVFSVGGPQILRRDQIPDLFGRLFAREPFIVRVPLDVLDGGRTLLNWIDPELSRSLGTLRTLLAHEFYCTHEEVARLQNTFGISLETLESYLRRYLDL